MYPRSPATLTVGRKLPYAFLTPHFAGDASLSVCRYAGLLDRACWIASWSDSVTVGGCRGATAVVSGRWAVVVSWAFPRVGRRHATARKPSQRFMDDALCAGDVTGANTAALPHRFQ